MKSIIAGFTGTAWAVYVAASILPTWSLTPYSDPAMIVALILTALCYLVYKQKPVAISEDT